MSSRARDRPRGQAARGPRLFERACRLVRDGIRHQRPGLTDEGADPLLAARLARRLSRLELPRHPTFHGIADFVIETAPGPLQRLQAALPSGLRLQPRVSFEAVRGTVRHLIVLTGSHVVCELFALSDDPHDRARFDRRQEVSMLWTTGLRRVRRGHDRRERA